MSLFPSAGFVATSASANSLKLMADHYGLWDAITKTAAERGLIPRSMLGRLATVLGTFYAGAILDWHLGEDTAIGRVFKELLLDAPSELGARVVSLTDGQLLEILKRPSPPQAPAPSMGATLIGGLDALADFLVPGIGKK